MLDQSDHGSELKASGDEMTDLLTALHLSVVMLTTGMLTSRARAQNTTSRAQHKASAGRGCGNERHARTKEHALAAAALHHLGQRPGACMPCVAASSSSL